jgi:hypothetical protein
MMVIVKRENEDVEEWRETDGGKHAVLRMM